MRPSWRFEPSLPLIRRLPDRRALARDDGLDVVGHSWSQAEQRLSLITGDGRLIRWSTDDERREIYDFEGAILNVVEAPDGGFAVSLRTGEMLLFDRSRRELRRRLVENAVVHSIDPGQDRVVLRRSHAVVVERQERPEELFEVRFQDRIRLLEVDWERSRAIVVDDRDQLTVFDLEGKEERQIRALNHREGAVMTLSPDGTQLAIGFWSGGAEVWNLDEMERLTDLPGHGDSVTSLRFSADGTIVFTGAEDHLIRAFSSAGGDELFRLQGHRRGPIDFILDAKEEYLISVAQDRTLCVWDLGGHRATMCIALNTLPRQVRLIERWDQIYVELIDESYHLWAWKLDEFLAVSGDLLSYSGALTNLRLCRDSGEVVAVLPIPPDDSIWAAKENCPAALP